MSAPHEPVGPARVPPEVRVQQLLSVGMLEQAKRMAADAVSSAPDDASSWRALTLALLAGRETEGALNAAAEAVRRDPAHSGTHALRGHALLQGGRWAEAELAFREALALDPTNDHAAASYGRLLWLLDRNRAALAWVERAIGLDPGDPDHHALHAQILLTVPAAAWTRSEESARRALALDPQNPDAEAALGCVLLRERKWDEAEQRFRGALRRQPHHPLALRGLAELTMSRSWLYRPMLGFGMALERLSPDGRLGFFFGLWVLYGSLSAALGAAGLAGVANALFYVYMGLCLWTWFAEPVTRWLLSRRYPWLRSA